MKKTLIILVVAVVIAIAAFFLAPRPQDDGAKPSVSDPRNTTYVIEDATITLKGGSATEKVPGSSAEQKTLVFEAATSGDVNGDGIADTVVILSRTDGGTGVFYYAAVAVQTANGYTGTNAILLGDRIAPQTTEVRDGFVIVNYAIRNDDEPMTAQPSVGVSKYLRMQGMTLVDVSIANPMIQVLNVVPGQQVSSPLVINGIAKGPWYFEASFPIEMRDQNNALIGQTVATAQSDWMTTNFVPFTAAISFTGTPGQSGMLILRKDNPSGEPQNDDSISIPVIF